MQRAEISRSLGDGCNTTNPKAETGATTTAERPDTTHKLTCNCGTEAEQRRSIVYLTQSSRPRKAYMNGEQQRYGHGSASTSDIYALRDPVSLGLALAATESIIEDICALAPVAFHLTITAKDGSSNTDNERKMSDLRAGAGEGNRTLVVSLEGFCSTIELHPPAQPCLARNNSGGQGWIRTSVRLHGQIYSLLPLTTRPPVHQVSSRRTVRSW